MKTVITKKMFETVEIMPEELLNRNGKPYRSKCVIKVNTDYYRVAHSYREIEGLIRPFEIKGFGG